MRNASRLLVSGIALLLVACDPMSTSDPSPVAPTSAAGGPTARGVFSSTYADAECPQDVRDAAVVPILCGYLTVLEDRSNPSSRRLRLLVSRIEPHDGPKAADPMIVLADIRTGSYPDYGGLVEIADRVSRLVYVLDPRGAAHSDPILDCPEITAASRTLVGLRMADPAHAAALRGAVRGCRERLANAGVDPAHYGARDVVADFHDLRTALGMGTWNAIAYGPASELAFAIDGPDRDALRSMSLDSPTLGQDNWRTLGPAALDMAIDRFAAACAAAASCAAGTPDVAAAIEAAVAVLEAQPLELDVDGTPEAIVLGHPIHVMVDGVAFLRWIRSQLGRQRPDGALILATVAKARDRAIASSDLVAVQLSSDVGLCLGTLPRCDVNVAWGSVFSLVCAGPINAAANARFTADIAGRAAYATMFSAGPFDLACEEWPAAGGSIDARPVAGSPVATLIYRGSFNPFTATPEQIGDALGASGAIHIVEVPNGSSNVLGAFECARAIRNAWLDAPDRPPGDTSCIEAIPEIPLPN